MKKIRIALFASGSGSNALRIMEYFKGHPSIEVALLLSNKSDAGALLHAQNHKVANYYLSNFEFRDGQSILEKLKQHQVDAIVLAGFLLLIPSNLIAAYEDKILNIHPSLLPKHGGKGMYGHKVHEAVEKACERESGITIHLVNERFDEGRVIAQFRVPLDLGVNATEIEAEVRVLEIVHYAPAIENWLLNSGQ